LNLTEGTLHILAHKSRIKELNRYYIVYSIYFNVTLK